MTSIKYIAAAILMAASVAIKAQELRLVNFPELEQELKKGSDTLKVVNFWASWCGPCIAEMPHFVKAQEEWKTAKVKFIYVSLDFVKNIQNAEKVARKKGLEGTWFLLKDDPNTYVNKIDPNWEGQIPVTLLVKPDQGYKIHYGQFTSYEELNTFIQEHVK